MSTVEKGDALEEFVLEYVNDEIAAGRFLFLPQATQVGRRRSYFSKDRGSNIVFDISIEARLPGTEKPSLLVLIACKNYDHPVPVDDVEEFFAKIQQVGAANTKGILFSTHSFQRGSLAFAESKSIGLVRVFPNGQIKWELQRTAFIPDVDGKKQTAHRIKEGMLNGLYQSRRSIFYCYSGGRFHSSINRTVGALLTPTEFKCLAPVRRKPTAAEPVPFLSRDIIDSTCQKLLDESRYENGPVKLSDICGRLGLDIVESNGRLGIDADRAILGRANFETKQITLYPDSSNGRRRFTLAHELGHFALGHGQYLRKEAVDEQDFQYCADEDRDSQTIRRLEWQANYFASHILLPTKSFLAQLERVAAKYDLRDKGHGLIYVDHQPINQSVYHAVTLAIGAYFQTSKAAVTLRLTSLGLLNDQRGMKSFKFSDECTSNDRTRVFSEAAVRRSGQLCAATVRVLLTPR